MEEGESATTLDRTELQRLLEYCRKNKGKVQVMVVYALNRFSRETLDHKTLRVLLLSYGVTLRSVTEPIDDTPEGEFMEHIISGVSQYENRQRARRTVAGMKNKVDKGGWPFKTPLGYCNVIDANEQRTVIPDPERAPLIKTAFEMFATGLHTKQEVLRRVNGMGLRARDRKAVSIQTLDRTLKNPFYAGILQVQGKKVKDWHQEQTASFEAIISRETFDRVQAILSGRKVTVTPRQRNHQDFPLRHFVRCGACGRPLTGSWNTGRAGRKYAFYRCQNRHCPAKSKNIKKQVLEARFVAFLTQLQPRAEYLRLYRAIVMDVWNKKQADAHQRLAGLEGKIADLRERKTKLNEAFVYHQTLPREDYLAMKAALEGELALAEIEHREAQSMELDIDAVINFAENIFLDAARVWQEMKLDQKQRFQQVLFPEGVQYEDGVYRTERTCLMFSDLQQEELEKTQLVALPGIEPGFED